MWICPDNLAGQELRVYNWTTYIAEDTISNFEQMCGVTVIYNTYGSDSEMLEELRAGTLEADLVVPSDATVYLMAEQGLLLPLEYRNIPNFANISEQFRNPPYDPNNALTVPYQWGTVGVGYNRTAVGREITSWNDVFEYEGRVAWLDESTTMMNIALNVLGYEANTTDPAAIAAAEQFLIEHSDNVVEIAPDTGQDLLVNGQADIAIEYSGDIFQIINDCACDTYAYTIPNEGALIWIDNLGVPRGAANQRLAEIFIDYLLQPQVGADISNYTAYASPNQVAIDEGLIDSASLDNPGIYPDAARLEASFFNIPSREIEGLYGAAWENIRAAVGN